MSAPSTSRTTWHKPTTAGAARPLAFSPIQIRLWSTSEAGGRRLFQPLLQDATCRVAKNLQQYRTVWYLSAVRPGSGRRVRKGEAISSQTMRLAPTSPGLVHCIVRALLLSIDPNLQLRNTMLWSRLVFLVLLPLGLGGCWESSTRLSSPPTASSSQYGLHSSAGDDLPTPRLFQYQNWSAPSE